jgi:serine/threonine-protein kinase
MAEVYLAHDEVLDRHVALKILRRRYADDEEFVERFRREAYSAGALSHPNIVSFFDRGKSDDGTYYIAMEYLPGGTLKDCMLRRGCFPAHTAAAVDTQIAEALEAAHRHGVIHRDVKPENILVTESGDVKVTDFGIARAATSLKITHSGIILGTAHYVSPEQAMGEPAGPHSDLYSLGVVLYEMLIGELPYDADSSLGVAIKHVNGQLRPPQEVDPLIPAGINAVTVRLLAKDPEDRYPDAGSLLEDLDRMEKGLALAAATTQTLPRLAAQAPSNRWSTTQRSAVRVPSPTPYREAPHWKQWRRKIFSRATVVSFLTAVALTGAIVWSLGQHFQEQNDVPVLDVPSLVGMTLEEAQNEVGGDFDLRPQEQESNQSAGTILDQDLKNGEKAEKGASIGVVISSGKESVKIPDVKGQDLTEASRTLQDAGLTVRWKYKTAKSGEPKDTVIGTDPPAGSKVEADTSVTLIASSGTLEETATQLDTQQPDPNLTLSADPASWVALQEPTQEQLALQEPAQEQPAPEDQPSLQEPTPTQEQPTPQEPAVGRSTEARKKIPEDWGKVQEQVQEKAKAGQKGAQKAGKPRS